jgi:hypothetical protein
MRAWKWVGIVAAIMLLCSFTLAHVRNGGPGESVKGLRSVFVSVHIDGRSLAGSGLTNPQVWSAVVLRLRLAGLTVLNEGEWEKTQGKPYLYVHLSDTALSEQGGHPAGYVCTCSFDLMQDVALARQPRSHVDACTWSRGATLIVPPNDLAQVRILVDNLATEFTSDVTAANNNGSEPSLPEVPLEKQ